VTILPSRVRVSLWGAFTDGTAVLTRLRGEDGAGVFSWKTWWSTGPRETPMRVGEPLPIDDDEET
jgi:hypothetical protein